MTSCSARWESERGRGGGEVEGTAQREEKGVERMEGERATTLSYVYT